MSQATKNLTSLSEILDNNHEQCFFHAPPIYTDIHPYYITITWLLNLVLPTKIAIFENDKIITQKNICEIIRSFDMKTKCYIDKRNKHYPLYPEIIQSFDTIPSWQDISLLYIDSSTESLKDHSVLHSITNPILNNTLFIFSNIYHNNYINRNNLTLIKDLQQQYQSFEFTHHNGLLVLYTGHILAQHLEEFFNLNQNPKSAHELRKRCAFMDQYWQNISISYEENQQKTEVITAKAQTQLSEQKNYYLQIKIALLQTNQNQLVEWKDHITEKLHAIQFLFKKYHSITRFFPHKLYQLLHFQDPPNVTLITENNIKLQSYQSLTASDKNNPYRHRRIIFIVGEPETPGAIYRCYRNAQACCLSGHEAKVINAANINHKDVEWADILILWRVEFSEHILNLLNLATDLNVLTAFDSDDIVFKVHYAFIDIIDGIRSIGTTESETARTFNNMRQTLMRTNFAVATTDEMREHLAQELIPKHAGPLVFKLPNVFDDICLQISRFSARLKALSEPDSFIRIGYASGTRTHQRDFAVAIPALIAIFKKRPQVKLVLFREPHNHRPILHMNEFPELNDFHDRIEWRDTVPLQDLPRELARFDISIAPLEVNNVFCNAKSELKYFEAALANVPSVVSPTGPLKRCIENKITGFLANSDEEWETSLLQLIDDESLRKTMARNAYHSVLWNFSIQRQSYLCDTILCSLIDEKNAAKSIETMIARKEYTTPHLPIIPESEILFNYDALKEAEVTVVITSYNYSQYIIEAMESVKNQTLENIDLIIVDDGSSDDSVNLILHWAETYKTHFNRLKLHRSLKNAGLGGARNIGISASETLYSMQLDADNRLCPDTCEKLLSALKNTNIGYAYPHLRHFGAGEAIGGHVPFHPLRLSVGNYIDAMAMLPKWAWAAVGGYYVQRDAMGWEDYDIWCCLAEMGIQGTQVKDAIAEYRAHFSSMTNTVTEQTYHKPKVTSYLAKRHPWIKLVLPEETPRIKKKNN